jgi:hypothetical protein
VVSVAVYAGRRNKPGEPLEELERREEDFGAPVGRGPWEAVEQPGFGRGEGSRAARGMKSFEGEGWPSTVAQEALDAGTVVTLDADGGVNAEATGALPGEHALGIGFVEKAAGAEVPEHTALNDALEVVPMDLLEQRCFVEADGPVRDLGEDAVEDDEVKVKVGVQSRPEAVQERDGAESGVVGRAGTGGAEGGADGAQEDPKDGAGDVRVVVEVGTQALG